MSAEIKGLDSLRRKLQSLGGELEQATEKGVWPAGRRSIFSGFGS